jgi:hypothetical protein
LSQAQAGDSILLAPGTYSPWISNLNISGSGVTIGSLNAAIPAVLTGLQINGSSGLNFTNLDVIGSGSSAYAYANVTNSTNVSFSNMLFEGSNPIAINDSGGLSIQNSTGVSVTNSTFEQLGTVAIATGSDNGVTLAGNAFFNLGEDGIDSAGTSNITISGNSFSDFVSTSTMHPDAIQFWTSGTSGSAENITITNNIITRGPGMTTQGIFMQDNGGTQPFLNLTISGNTLVGIPYNAIYVDGSVGAHITGNTIQAYTDYTAFLFVGDSANATVTNNAAPQYCYQNNTGLAQSGDTVTSAITQPLPILTSTGAAATYTAGGAAAIAPSIAVADLGSTILETAHVAITGGFTAGDILSVTAPSGLACSYDASAGVLTLTGLATLATYQHALDSITYSSSAGDPTRSGADPTRTISFSVNDGSHDSFALAATVDVGAGSPSSPSSPPPPPPPPPPAPVSTASPLPPPAAPSSLTLDHATDSGAQGDNLTNVSQVRIDGVAPLGSTVTLFDGATAIGTGVANASTGAFSIAASAPLAEGAHTLTATANSAGLVSAPSSPLTVTIDTHAPVASLAFATAVPTSAGETVTLAGATSGAVSGVPYSIAILQDGTQIGSVTPTNGTWSFQALNVSTTTHTYTIQTTDAAGNTAAGANDAIVGAPHSSIVAGAGQNLIVGGAGDTITGGAGSNTFIINSINQALGGRSNSGFVQTITNWVSGSDHFDLTGLGALTFGGQNQTVSPHSVDWYTSGGNTFVVGDTAGHGHGTFTIELVGIHNLTSSDFLLG